jgi:copper chaperone NosL
MLTLRRASAVAVLAALPSCTSGPPPPVALDVGRVACASCRMIVSDRHFASEIVSRYEEPLFFDDLGCLTRFLAGTPALASGAVTYVADHRTGEWVPADRAVYSAVPTLTAAMGSHVVAHASEESRAADAMAAGGRVVSQAEVFGERRPPGGVR